MIYIQNEYQREESTDEWKDEFNTCVYVGIHTPLEENV